MSFQHKSKEKKLCSMLAMSTLYYLAHLKSPQDFALATITLLS